MYLNCVARVCTAGPCRVGELVTSIPASSAIRSARMACQGSVTRTAVLHPRAVNSPATARMLSRVSPPCSTASSASSGTPAAARYSRPASASLNSSPVALPPTVTITGATPSSYRSTACSSRASKIEEGTPLYCAEPSTTIASEPGRESPRAFHQIASAVEATSSRPASTAAPSTRTTSRPAHAATRHGYHARLTGRGVPGDGVPGAGDSARSARAAHLGAALGDDGELGADGRPAVVPPHLDVAHRLVVHPVAARPGHLRRARVQVLPGQLVGGDPGPLVVADEPVGGLGVAGGQRLGEDAGDLLGLVAGGSLEQHHAGDHQHGDEHRRA